jgi:hypothetical protein
LTLSAVGILAASSVAAQTAPTPPAPQQQPGAAAQVHTGTSQGVEEDTRVQTLLADHQFLKIEQELDKLTPEQAQLYRGVLANRNNDLKQSIQLLEPLVEQATVSGDAAHEKLARKALAEDYLRLGDWAKAANAYQMLTTRMEGKLSADEQDEIELPLKLLPLAAANPAMTVDACDPFTLQVSKNPLGLTDLPVFVDARPHSWMLDPTAPFNLIARSLAREAGLKVSDDAVTIHSLTGKPMKVHMTVVPRFTIGGRLTLRTMTAFVFEDADYQFKDSHYQVQGVLGYPALEALGSLTITSDETVEVRPAKQIMPDAKETAAATDGARFFLDGDQVIVALGAAGNERMFVVDAGGQQTYLTSRYFDEHAGEFAGQKMELYALPAAQSLPPVPAYTAESIALAIGSTSVDLHYIKVLTQPVGMAALDDVYGFLGMDALDQLHTYTFDYRTMRFRVTAE